MFAVSVSSHLIIAHKLKSSIACFSPIVITFWQITSFTIILFNCRNLELDMSYVASFSFPSCFKIFKDLIQKFINFKLSDILPKFVLKILIRLSYIFYFFSISTYWKKILKVFLTKIASLLSFVWLKVLFSTFFLQSSKFLHLHHCIAQNV